MIPVNISLSFNTDYSVFSQVRNFRGEPRSQLKNYISYLTARAKAWAMPYLGLIFAHRGAK